VRAAAEGACESVSNVGAWHSQLDVLQVLMQRSSTAYAGIVPSPPAPGHNHKLDLLQNPAAWPAAAAVGLARTLRDAVGLARAAEAADAGAAGGVGRPTMAKTMLLNGENRPRAR
jgi:hypothetical protein